MRIGFSVRSAIRLLFQASKSTSRGVSEQDDVPLDVLDRICDGKGDSAMAVDVRRASLAGS